MLRVFAVLAIGFAAIFCASWQSGSTREVCHTDKHSHKQECSTHNIALVPLAYAGGLLQEHGEAVIAAFTVILAGSTIALWQSTEKLWRGGEQQIKLSRKVAAVQARNTRRQLKISEETAERQLRAYVNVIKAQVAPPQEGGPILGKLLIKNAGQTPAYDLKAWIGVGVFDYTVGGNIEVPVPADMDQRPPSFVLAPGVEFPESISLIRRYTREEIQKLRAQKAAVIVFGKTTYRDAFGVQRVSEHRYLYGGDWGMPDTGEMVPMRESNTSS